ncbi:MAG: hypothetical protein AAF696_16065, partial [Bacteroidota bacterium]
MKRKTLFFVASMLALVLLSSCDIEPLDTSQSIVLTGRQTDPLVLTDHLTDANTPDYVVEGNFDILADVIVEPGVSILMENGSSIDVKIGGSFYSVGTESEKITIKGEKLLTPGQWKYIRFRSDNVDNRLEHTNISGGGSDGTYDAMVFIAYTGYAKIEHCIISFSQRNGIKCEDWRSRLGGIAYANVSFCELYPIQINAQHLPYIESTNRGDGNTHNYINVEGSQLTNPLRWKKSTFLPYKINGTLSMTDAVQVEAGTTIFMADGSKIQVSREGSFNCVGTESEKIRIIGENRVNGAWGYIRFTNSNSPQNRFEHCEIAYGGGDNNWEGILTLVYGSTVSMRNSEIKGSARYAVQVQHSQGNFIDEGDNTFSENT